MGEGGAWKALQEYYEKLYAEHGQSPLAVDQRDYAQMDLRFRKLVEIAPGALGGGCRILEVGSGLGDLYGFLDRVGGRNCDYVGIEMVTGFVKAAQERYPAARFVEGEFLSSDVSEACEWAFLNGSLNVRCAGIEALARRVIEKMYASCSRGAAFNLMSTYVDYQDAKLAYYQPEEIFRFCRTLTPFVTLRHDYPLWEFTVYLYKPEWKMAEPGGYGDRRY